MLNDDTLAQFDHIFRSSLRTDMLGKLSHSHLPYGASQLASSQKRRSEVRFDTPSVVTGASELLERLRTHRREVHKQPELGFAEHRTAAYIESVLDDIGVEHRRVVGTGVVGVIRGDVAGCIGVRADMDGLPVAESTGREEYRSRVEGMSHACGHYGHFAVLVGLG